MCAFSLFVCVCFYSSAPGDLSKDDYHKNKHTLPSPTLLCFLPQNSPKQNKYENINPICSFRSESDFWGNLYGFWRLLFIFTSFGVVWVCSLLSDFIFITFLVSSAWTQYWQTSPSKTENCICYQLLMMQTWQTTSYGIRIHRLSYTLNPRPCHSIIYIN